MKNIVNLSLDELDSRITHFENRLTDTIICEDQVQFIKEMLRELRNAIRSKRARKIFSMAFNS